MSEIFQIDAHTWRIEDHGVRFFLLEGETDALLIDSGMNTPNARSIAEGLTKHPVKLLNTHADPDHLSGNGAFEEFYLSASEENRYRGFCPEGGKPILVKDGDLLKLGNRTLKIINLPGHTPGSIAVLDLAEKVLIGGDSIQDGRIFMFGEGRDLSLYLESLTALWEDHRQEFEWVYPSHGSFPVKPELIEKLISAAKEILKGEHQGKKVSFMGKEIVYHDFGFAGFLCDF